MLVFEEYAGMHFFEFVRVRPVSALPNFPVPGDMI
jgi:hypothetical protein